MTVITGNILQSFNCGFIKTGPL